MTVEIKILLLSYHIAYYTVDSLSFDGSSVSPPSYVTQQILYLYAAHFVYLRDVWIRTQRVKSLSKYLSVYSIELKHRVSTENAYE